jgi:hypothetical protein
MIIFFNPTKQYACKENYILEELQYIILHFQQLQQQFDDLDSYSDKEINSMKKDELKELIFKIRNQNIYQEMTEGITDLLNNLEEQDRK